MALRLFAAATPSDAVRAELAAFAERLAPGCPGFRWADPAGLHLTLKFFGPVEEARIPALEEALARAASSASFFTARLAGAGVFPDTRKPQVVWAGIDEGGPQFVRLARSVEEETEAIGYEPEPRPFRPHVTLGRSRQGADGRLTGETVQRAVFESSPWTVDSLRLYVSRSSSAGSVYETLHIFPFSR